MTSASKDAKLIAVAVAMGFGAVVFTPIDVFAPETGLIEMLAPAMLPMAVVMIADLIGFTESPTLGEIARLVSALELSGSIHDRAAELYREVCEKETLAGNSTEGMATACVYAACRFERLPRTLKEVGELARIDTKEINRDYKHLIEILSSRICRSWSWRSVETRTYNATWVTLSVPAE